MRRTLLFIVAALACAACSKNPGAEVGPSTSRPAPPPGQPPMGGPMGQLPPDHPPMGAGSGMGMGMGAPAADPGITWTAPASWQKAQNPSAMRLATYKIPRAAGDAEDGDLSIMQAGGSLEMNIERWAKQFSPPADASKRKEKQVGGVKVTIVEMTGAFTAGGMGMGGPNAGTKPGFAMLAAIAETQMPTFFKLTGPEKTVMAAKADFEKMVDSLKTK